MKISKVVAFDARGKRILISDRDKEIADFYYEKQSKNWPALGRDRRLKKTISQALKVIEVAGSSACTRVSKLFGVGGGL